VALALTCYEGGPCEKLSVISDDPAIAEVRRASLGRLERSGMYGQATSAALVVVGKSPGTTRIRVRSKDGHRDIAVTVIPPPGPISVQAVSRQARARQAAARSRPAR
jgi:hypothetical protein